MKPIIVANWKMNPATKKEALLLAGAIAKRKSKSIVVLCPPFVYLPFLLPYRKRMRLGAQNCSWQEKGALTGEISASQLKNLGCEYVILGHSERKKYLGETKEQIARKTREALAAGLKVVLCVEHARELALLQERVNLKGKKNLLVVFEPSFAISTQGGKRVPLKRIGKEIAAMKKLLGRGSSVLYGGSVDATSIQGILREGGADGVLVGAASLNPREFAELVKRADMA